MTVPTQEIPEPYLAAPSDLAERLGLTGTTPPVLLALRRVSDRFRGEVGHPVHLVTDDEYWASGDGSASLHLPAAPVIGTPTITLDGTPVTGFQVGRRAGLIRRTTGCWPDGLDNILVTYTHGYPSIPGDIQDAVLDVAEAACNLQAGIESVTTGGESVKFVTAIAAGGSTEAWTNAVAKYKLGEGDRS